MDQPGADQTFTALADPTRRSILRLLRDGEFSVGKIAEEFSDIGRTAVSAHIRVLRQAHLITERRQGKYRIYSLSHDAASEVVLFLQEVYRQSLAELVQPRLENGTIPASEQAPPVRSGKTLEDDEEGDVSAWGT